MFLAVSIIDFCLQFTGLPTFLSLDVLGWLQSLGLGKGGSVLFQLVALLLTMFKAILLGMGMPAVPAYINVALLLGPVLAGLGIATFTAHMFIFYFAVASAITPPVALAAFAASSITKGRADDNRLFSGEIGHCDFYRALHLCHVSGNSADQRCGDRPISICRWGSHLCRDMTARWILPPLAGSLLLRLIVALYLVSSALARYDARELSWLEVGLLPIFAGRSGAAELSSNLPDRRAGCRADACYLAKSISDLPDFSISA